MLEKIENLGSKVKAKLMRLIRIFD